MLRPRRLLLSASMRGEQRIHMPDAIESAAALEPPVPIEPMDEHNRRLLANVHPPQWVNPEPADRYNLVVIGAGAGGLVSSIGAASLGAKVALVERHLLGGDCLNVGCVPSKALIRCARAYADLRDAEQYGVKVTGTADVDFAAVMERMRRLRAQISRNDSVQRLRSEGVDVFLGDARFAGPNSVEVDGRRLHFRKAVIATGARPSAPPIPGLAETGYLTNENIFWLTELPKRLAVIGAGPIGCELAQAFARLGSKVSLFEAMHGIMPNEDRDAADVVWDSMARDGVELFCCGQHLTVSRDPDGKRLVVDSHGRHVDVMVDEILVGVGKKPNVEGLNLQAAGVGYDLKKGVLVNDRMQTSNRNIYAVGDVCYPHKFTHVSDALARIALRNALFFGRAKASDLVIPWCTYTDPEVAHVGMYEKNAKEQGIEVETYRVDLSDVDRAILDGEDRGFVKVLTRKGTHKILGATLVARHAGEMISEITLAMVAGAGLKTLSKTIHPYPTQAEVIRKAGDAYFRSRLTPTVKKLFAKFLAWRR